MFASQIPEHEDKLMLVQDLISKTDSEAVFRTQIIKGGKVIYTEKAAFTAQGDIEHYDASGEYPDYADLTEQIEDVIAMYAGEKITRFVYVNS